MAKKYPKRHGVTRGRYMKGRIDEALQLGTLAAATIVTDLWNDSVVDRTLLSSILCTWTLSNLTTAQGPIAFGVAHSDYTDAEIEACIETIDSWNEGNLPAREVGNRKVRQIGTFVGEAAAGGTVDVQFNDGKPIKTKLNWILTNGDALTMWAYNLSTGALATTDPLMRAVGYANLFKGV